MITTLALSLLSLTLMLIIIRLERELWQARQQWKFEHEIAVILQGIARKEWRIAQAWKERAQGGDVDDVPIERLQTLARYHDIPAAFLDAFRGDE